MTDQVLNILKFVLLGLLYLFFARVLWAVWSEVRTPSRRPIANAPRNVPAPAPRPAAAPAPSRRWVTVGQTILGGLLALAALVAGLTASELFRQESLFHAMLKASGMDYDANPVVQELRRIGVASAR